MKKEMETPYLTSYENIFFDIKCKIINGELKKGDQLPTIDELCKIYSASNITIKDSIKMLKQHGYVKSIERVGNYVNERKKQNYKFEIDEIKCLKEKPDKSKIIKFEIIEGEEVSKELSFFDFKSNYFLKIERVHYFGELPVLYDIIWLMHTKKVNLSKLDQLNWINMELDVLNNFEIIKDVTLLIKNDNPEIEKLLFLPAKAPVFEITKKYLTRKLAKVGLSKHYASCDDMRIESL